MTADNLPSPYVASSSTPHFGQAWNAFDGSVVSYLHDWQGQGNTCWLKIDLGSSKLVSGYGIQVDDYPEPDLAPKTWTYQGSLDDITYTTLDTQASQTAWGSAERRDWAVSPGNYRYLLLDITDNNGGANTQIAEMYIAGDPGEGVAKVNLSSFLAPPASGRVAKANLYSFIVPADPCVCAPQNVFY